MTKKNIVAAVWIVVAVAYGLGLYLMDETWFTIGGAMFIALVAVTSGWWSSKIPDDSTR